MPSYPYPTSSAGAIKFSGFGSVAGRIAELMSQGSLIPLHLGDTYLSPPPSVGKISLDETRLYRYGPLEGFPELRAGIAERVSKRFGLRAEKKDVFITPGAIGGLSLLTDALFDPYEEVIVLTPTWPVIFGILTRRGVVVKEVPVGAGGIPDTNSNDLTARLKKAVTERTKGIYFCNPNNPAGFVFDENQAKAIVNFAIEHSLWFLEDIAYADLVFDRNFTPVSCDSQISDRALIVGTFSKSHALAGQRIGYVIAPPQIQEIMPRLLMHTTYHTSAVAQRMALACLSCTEKEEQEILDSYIEGARTTQESLSCLTAPARAGAFVLLDLQPYGILGRDEVDRFLSALLDRHVSLCPGFVVGQEYESFARLCFTAVPPEQLRDGIARINEVLKIWR